MSYDLETLFKCGFKNSLYEGFEPISYGKLRKIVILLTSSKGVSEGILGAENEAFSITGKSKKDLRLAM